MAHTSFTEVQPTGSLAAPAAPRREARGERERGLATRNRRRARSSHELTQLFSQRSDLEGVSPVADFFVESVRWSA